MFQKNFLKKFNFGNPEILRTILQLKLKIKFKNKGKEVIKCAMK